MRTPTDRTQPAPCPRAFTLVELLVAIGVIAILASLLLPALSHGRSKALSLRSISNARQLGLGMHLYAQDYSQLPRDPREAGATNWVFTIEPYLGTVDGLRTCPADPWREARRKARSCGYVLNYYTSGGRPPSFDNPEGDPLFGFDPDRNVDAYPRPAETFLLFEASNAGLDRDHPLAFDDHSHPDTWLLGWGHVLADIDPFRHGSGASYLFADWHLQTLNAARLRSRIEAGDNFAVIPR
jgi:prepilin-type N-terminal cleavage/methylation domain-containing protein/prepilin-type processing-associated H-X9-DG protein